MLLIQKPSRKPKRKKYKIATRSVFKEWGKNGTKVYRRRLTDAQVMAKALKCKAERLEDMPVAQRAFNELLDGMGVLYESEKIVLNGDRWIMIDCYVPSGKIAFEVDGLHHQTKQLKYDQGRDAWLRRVHGVRTIRIANREILGDKESVKSLVRRTLNPGD